MSEAITGNAVALSLMREALTLLDTDETAEAAGHLRRAIAAVEHAPLTLPEERDDPAHLSK